MKLTFNFFEGTIINGEGVKQAEGNDNYSLEQIIQTLEGLKKGYEIRFNYDDRESIVIAASQVKSVDILL